MTTHWQNAQHLAELFPKAQVELDRIHLRDGALVTSAGVTAGIDLALALVAEHHGARVSLAVAKRLVVVAQRQGGQSQFSPFLTAPADPDSPIARVQAHVMQHIGASFTVEALAQVAGMSGRNLARLFVQETGVTPHEFVERARVDAARNLLEGSDRASRPWPMIAASAAPTACASSSPSASASPRPVPRQLPGAGWGGVRSAGPIAPQSELRTACAIVFCRSKSARRCRISSAERRSMLQ